MEKLLKKVATPQVTSEGRAQITLNTQHYNTQHYDIKHLTLDNYCALRAQSLLSSCFGVL